MKLSLKSQRQQWNERKKKYKTFCLIFLINAISFHKHHCYFLTKKVILLLHYSIPYRSQTINSYLKRHGKIFTFCFNMLHVFFIGPSKFRLRLDVLILLKIFSLKCIFLLTFLIEIQTKSKKRLFDKDYCPFHPKKHFNLHLR